MCPDIVTATLDAVNGRSFDLCILAGLKSYIDIANGVRCPVVLVNIDKKEKVSQTLAERARTEEVAEANVAEGIELRVAVVSPRKIMFCVDGAPTTRHLFNWFMSVFFLKKKKKI